MTRYDQPQIEALRWALDKIETQFAKARRARPQVPQEIEDNTGEDDQKQGTVTRLEKNE